MYMSNHHVIRFAGRDGIGVPLFPAVGVDRGEGVLEGTCRRSFWGS
jgi:hypothetical protein